MANFLLGAALKGLGDGGQMVGKSLMDDVGRRERLEDELRLKRELQAEELRQRADLGLGVRGGAGTGGGSTRGGGSGIATGPFDRASFDDRTAAVSGFSSGEDMRQFEAGNNNMFTRARKLENPVANDDEGNPLPDPGSVVEVPKNLAELRARKLQEINDRRQELVFGGQYDDVTKGRLNQQKVGQLDRYEAGNDQAGRAALVGAGKGVYDGNTDITRDVINGGTETTRVGDADIKLKKSGESENYAQADKYRAQAEAERQAMLAGGGVKGATTERLSTQLNSVNAAIKNLTENPPRSSDNAEAKKAHGEALAMYQDLQRSLGREMRSRMDGSSAPPAPSPSPAPSPAPGAAPRPGRFASTPEDMDRPRALQGELDRAQQALAAARTTEERTRAEQDIAALQRELGRMGKPGAPARAPAAAAANDAPPANLLKEGVRTTFRNGQTWTLRNGTPTKVN